MYEPCMNIVTFLYFQSSDSFFTCVCKEGFTGRRCEIERHACESSPCVNGICIDQLDGKYSCDCDSGFEGKDTYMYIKQKLSA